MDKFFDAHVHLQTLDNFPEIMKESEQAGLTGFICNSTSPADWEEVSEISKTYEGVYPCFGVHPLYVEKLPKDWAIRLRKILIENPKAMVGEIGLDKFGVDLDFQEMVFRTQLDLANELDRPAHIHCVRCWDRLLHVFKTQKEKRRMPPRILSHSHHGDKDLIPRLMEEYNAYFSYSSIFVPDNHPKVQACLRATPLDRLLIESDAMGKVDSKAVGLSKSPLDVIDLVPKMSVISGHKLPALKEALYKNAMEFVNG